MNDNARALRVARAVLRWSIREVADITGLHPVTIGEYEAGRSRPSPESLELLRVAYGEALTNAETYYGPCATRVRGRPRTAPLA